MPLIEIRGLKKFYQMGDTIVRALDGVDLDIERGEFVAITGASGSGKSTIMHLIGCLDRPTAGQYRLDGRDVSDLSDRELARVRNQQIGFVFQTFNLINRTSALENVGVPLFYARKTNGRGPALAALERVGLAPRAEHNPNELSGGERQRVAIARAMVNDPPLLLADEPTGNLDSRTGEQIMQIFESLNAQGVTVVMVTHEPDIAMRARRVVQMRDGRIVADRRTEEVMAEEGWRTRPQQPEVAGPRAGEVLPVAEQAEPAAQELESEQLPARVMRGSNAVLACGIVSPALYGLAVVLFVILQYYYDPQSFKPGTLPPTPFLVASLGGLALMLVGIVLGAVTILLGRGVRRRIRTEPGNWLGGRKAVFGEVLGWLGVLVPVGMCVFGIVYNVATGGSGAISGGAAGGG